MLFKRSHCPSPLLSHGLACHVSDCSVTMACAGLTQCSSAPLVPSSSGNEGPGMEFRFSTHQPENSARGVDSVDWLWAEKSHVLSALVA